AGCIERGVWPSGSRNARGFAGKTLSSCHNKAVRAAWLRDVRSLSGLCTALTKQRSSIREPRARLAGNSMEQTAERGECLPPRQLRQVHLAGEPAAFLRPHREQP